MPGPSPGGSPEREVGTGGRQRGPGRGRRVRFRLPPTAIALPSVREEEQVFYRRLEALAAPGPGGFGPLFAADGWSDLTEDRLLRKRLVRDGQDGLRPRPGQEVSVKVLGALEDGGLVERDPRLTFVPGYGDVVQALELGVLTMQPGEVAFFLAAFPYGYGRPGREPDVPPEAPLLFEVTLLEVREALDPQPLPPAARLRLGAQRRERGNFHFARGDFSAALRSYRLALSALDGPAAAPPGPQEEEELREQRVKCFNNCAAAEMKLQRVEEALAACEAALSISPDNGRALLRRGQVGPGQPRVEPLPGRPLPSAPLLAAAGAAGPGRGGRACPEESPGAGPRQRGLSGRGARLGAAPGPPGVPPQPRPPQPPRRPQVVHAELSRLVKRRSAPAAPQEPPHGPMPPPSSGDSAPPTAEGAA
ncbi:peptidyl-prolyl cis-trans isomerase FKBP8-like isoform X1 [Pezoporus wallicus]|uniref:peptidyl-prolyl cis-trans isomerase FKBP8-like isoform X1 n=1 Tax=Pezoporus wallicus TaxID=35540 RepID=UPI00254F6055|nr:peptidyl-prolyl cis-trans isomerase FKBP8-like isoform X1 [Pezoporus wallicus]